MRRSSSLAWATSVLVGVTACSFDGRGVPLEGDDDVIDEDAASPDAPSGPTDAAPDAPPPDAPPPDAPPPDAPPPDAPPDPDEDADNDTVPDGDDNCPSTPNSDQHDEDDDARGDVCDNCPHIANPGQENTTELLADGVGDACDPDPLGANVIAYFDGFGGSGAPSDWTAVGGSWTQAGDELRQTSAAVANHILYLTDGAFTDLVVHTAIDVNNVPPPTNNSNLRSVSFLIRYTPASQLGSGYLCSHFDDVSNDTPGYLIASRFTNDGSTPDGDIEAMTTKLEDGTALTLAGRAAGAAIRCEATTSSTVASSIANTMHASGTIALRTNSVAASYRHVVVITPAP